MMRNYILTALLMLCAVTAAAKVYAPEDVPNVQLADSTRYVSNPDGILSPEAVNEMDRLIASTRSATTAQMAVVMVNDIDRDINDFATRLFELWGVGNKGNSNGVLMVIAKEPRKVVIRTGYGTEGVLPDAVCSRIIRHDIAPEFREGRYDEGTVAAVRHITDILTDPEAAAEMRQGAEESQESGLDTSELFGWYLKLSMGIAGVMLAITIILIFTTRHSTEQKRWQTLNEFKPVLLFATFFAMGMPLIAYILLVIVMRRTRSRHRNCPNCGHKMKKLDEQSDNFYLTPSQDLEEHLNSVDYDVWLCPQCGEKDVIPYVNPRSAFSVCPNCGAKACSLSSDRITVQPTTSSKGQGVRTYSCANCHKPYYKNYIIPMLAAPVIVGGFGGGRGGGGGGFGGGSFGGGMTGGGGASGGW